MRNWARTPCSTWQPYNFLCLASCAHSCSQSEPDTTAGLCTLSSHCLTLCRSLFSDPVLCLLSCLHLRLPSILHCPHHQTSRHIRPATGAVTLTVIDLSRAYLRSTDPLRSLTKTLALLAIVPPPSVIPSTSSTSRRTLPRARATGRLVKETPSWPPLQSSKARSLPTMCQLLRMSLASPLVQMATPIIMRSSTSITTMLAWAVSQQEQCPIAVIAESYLVIAPTTWAVTRASTSSRFTRLSRATRRRLAQALLPRHRWPGLLCLRLLILHRPTPSAASTLLALLFLPTALHPPLVTTA